MSRHILRVPTAEQYAYIEAEFDGSPEEAFAEYQRLTALVQGKQEGGFTEFKTFTGETILYNNETHRYTTKDGKPLLSGSAYKKSLEAPFSEMIAKTTARKYHIPEDDIRAMWKLNGACSTKFGDALHKAMELYRKYAHHKEVLTSHKDVKEYFLPKNSTLRKAVLAFPDTSPGHAEIMVSAVELGMVGQIDWLSTSGEKDGVVEDYKSDMDIKKNLAGHFNQLSFYAHILIHHGWTIPSLRVWNWDGDKWTSYDSPVLELKGELTK